MANNKINQPNKVFYIEPNYNETLVRRLNNEAARYYTKPEEDLCIFVDLEVEVFDRNVEFSTGGASKVYILQYKTSTDGAASTSFWSGKKYQYKNGNKDNNFNILTTDYTETFYDDIVRDSTYDINRNTECFGVESIDIQYDNYAVPKITIKFKDIRGASLFAPEELRHGKKDANGIGGMASDDIAGSFFKCFFTFPYPRFTLKVKGFYGEPVSYDLTCSKFYANFNSESGDFGATCELVGYMYSLLNDISLHALLAAPMCKYYGKDYWDSVILKGEEYKLSNGSSPITFQQLMKVLNSDEFKSAEAKSKEEEASGDEIKQNAEKKKVLDEILEKYRQEVSRLLNLCNEKGVTPIYDDSKPINEILVVCNSSTDKIYNALNDFKFDLGETNNIVLKEAAVKELNAKLTYLKNKIHIVKGSSVYEFLNDEETSKISEGFKNKAIAELNSRSGSKTTNLSFFYVNNKDFLEFISLKSKEVDDERINLEEQFKEYRIERYEEVLGFKPSVENFVKITMCHLETLLFCISETTKNANNMLPSRPISVFKFGSSRDSGLDTRGNDCVPAWPKVTTEQHNAFRDSWIGEVVNDLRIVPEAQLVEEMFNSISALTEEIKNQVVADKANTMKRNTAQVKGMPFPFMLSDNIFEGSCFGNDVLFKGGNTLEDIIKKIFIRCINVTALNFDGNMDYVADCGRMDAHNFYARYKKQITKNRRDELLTYKLDGLFEELIGGVVKYNPKHPERTRYLYYIMPEQKSEEIHRKSKGSGIEHDNNAFPIYDTEYEDIKSLKSTTGLTYEDYDKYLINTSKVKNDDYAACRNNILFFEKNKFLKFRVPVANEEVKNVSDKLSTIVKENNIDKIEFSKDNFYNFYIPACSIINSIKRNDNNEEYISSGLHSISIKNDRASCIIDNNIDCTLMQCNVSELDSTLNFSKERFFWQNGLSQDIVSTNILVGANFNGDNISIYEKALLFLECVIVKKNVHTFVTEYSESGTLYTTKATLLYIGAILHHYIEKDSIPESFKNDEAVTCFVKGDTSWFKKIFSSSKEDDVSDFEKYRFISYFEDWVNKEFEPNIYSKIRIRYKGNKGWQDLLNALKKNTNLEDVVYNADTIIEVFNFYNDKGLYFRRETSTNKKITELYLTPILIVKFGGIRRLLENVTHDKLKKYYLAFRGEFDRLLEQAKKDEYNAKPISEAEISNVPNEMKIALYNYFRIIHDKWLHAEMLETWKVANFYPHFHYIDPYYNKIGDIALINPLDIGKLITDSLAQSEYTLLSFLSKILANNNIAIQTVQNFFDLERNEDFIYKMQNMFEPIAYLDMKDAETVPHFICIYIGETSNHLNIEGSSYLTDSFDLSDIDNWPQAIKNKDEYNGYTIPAFGVSIGSQYQSYFTNLAVSSENPTTTEHALKATFLIAGMNSANGNENSEKTYTLGQDLFTVYANNSYACNVTMMGCAWIQPLMYFVVNNVPMFRGSYLIQKVSHNITPGNMITNITGVRMANTLSPLVNKSIVKQPNTSFRVQQPRLAPGYYANIDNDCAYNKFDLPLRGSGINEAILTEPGGYNKYANKTDSRYDTILDALASTVANEAGPKGGTGDSLHAKLVATVLYNRWRHLCKENDFSKLFVKGQIAFENKVPENQMWKQEVKEIFTQTPMCIVGEQTNVNVPVTIFKDNIVTSQMTEPVEITKDMVQRIYCYCTSQGYDKSNPGGDKRTEEQKKYLEKHPDEFRTQTYFCHHQITKNSKNPKHGHVFVGTDKRWEYVEPKNLDEVEDNGLTVLTNDIMKMIQMSVAATEATKSCTLKFEKYKAKDTVLVTCTDTSKLDTVFDMIINTYKEYCAELAWVGISENSLPSTSHPDKILIKCVNGNASTHVISAGSLKGGDYQKLPMITKDTVHINFIKSLLKTYKNNNKALASDCKEMFKNSDADNTVSELSNGLATKDCATVQPNYVDLSNATLPSNVNLDDVISYTGTDGKQHIWNVGKSIATLIKNSNGYNNSKGKCADYVKRAMRNGGLTVGTGHAFECYEKGVIKNAGFEEIASLGPASLASVNAWTKENAKPGDIAIMTSSSEYGHICMYTGSQWISDFTQRSMLHNSGEVSQRLYIMRFQPKA